MREEFDPAEFGTTFRRFLDRIEQGVEGEDASFRTLLRSHFGDDPSEFPVVAQSLESTDLPNLQLAVAAYLERDGVEHELSGFGGPVEHTELSLSALVHDQAWGVRNGPVRRRVVELDGGRSLPCVTTGLYLARSAEVPFALLVAQSETGFGGPALRIEAMTEHEEAGEKLLAELRSLMRERNVYRGKVLVLNGGGDYGDEDMAVQFRDVPRVNREHIILPEGVLDIVELHTVEFAAHAQQLLDGGRHLRRGMLLHGPPGTGKTLIVSYLIGQLEERTVVILSGNALGLVAEACSLAKALAPSMVVLEDVDLVAQERMMDGPTSLLFELMNQIDGIGLDSDVIFLMTTNRADVLEPALAARPGRVDQAVAIPLPDEEGRRELLGLFCEGLAVSLEDPAPVIDATEGVSAAFIRELVGKAALVAARDASPITEDTHFAEALQLLEQGGSVTRAMLGADGGRALDELDGELGDEDWEEDEAE